MKRVWKFLRNITLTAVAGFVTATYTQRLYEGTFSWIKTFSALLVLLILGWIFLWKAPRSLPELSPQERKSRGLVRTLLCSVTLSNLFLLTVMLLRRFDVSGVRWWVAFLGTMVLGGVIEWWFFKPPRQS